MPPCMTTSVWPNAAIASAEANGSIVRSVPRVTLDDAKMRLAPNSAPVATTTVASPRDSKLVDPRRIASFDPSEPVICVTGLTWAPILTPN